MWHKIEFTVETHIYVWVKKDKTCPQHSRIRGDAPRKDWHWPSPVMQRGVMSSATDDQSFYHKKGCMHKNDLNKKLTQWQ